MHATTTLHKKEESRTRSQLINDQFMLDDDEKSRSKSYNNSPIPIPKISYKNSNHSSDLLYQRKRALSTTTVRRYSRRAKNDQILQTLQDDIKHNNHNDIDDDNDHINHVDNHLFIDPLRQTFEKISRQFMQRYDQLFTLFTSIKTDQQQLKKQNAKLKTENFKLQNMSDKQLNDIQTLNVEIHELKEKINEYELNYVNNINADLSHRRNSLSSISMNNSNNSMITKEDDPDATLIIDEHSHTDLQQEITPEAKTSDHVHDIKEPIDDDEKSGSNLVINLNGTPIVQYNDDEIDIINISPKFTFKHRISSGRQAIKPNTVAKLKEKYEIYDKMSKYDHDDNKNEKVDRLQSPMSPHNKSFGFNGSRSSSLSTTPSGGGGGKRSPLEMSKQDSYKRYSKKPKFKNKRKDKNLHRVRSFGSHEYETENGSITPKELKINIPTPKTKNSPKTLSPSLSQSKSNLTTPSKSPKNKKNKNHKRTSSIMNLPFFKKRKSKKKLMK